MKNKLFFPMLIAATAVLAACGGGGGDDALPPVQAASASTTVSGTAATGLALASSAVEVKCASGSGSATTNTNGSYTLSITDGSLPCIIRVTGEADGTTVTLHSVVEAGTTTGTTTTAIANVTPLTEMIVAQLTGTLPSELFDSFNASASTQITQAGLNTATTAVVTVIEDATGIDLGSVDPFKSQLVPATATTQGNAYDDYLESLKVQISLADLPLIVNQIAAAASAPASPELPSLASIVASADSFLPGCPAARSGMYRSIDYWGRTLVRQIDFKTMKYNFGNGDPLFDITADPQKPCEFTAAGTSNNEQFQTDFVMGPSGAGAYRGQNLTTARSVIGYLFPIQAHPVSAVVGKWSFLQTGYMPSDGVSHYAGQATFNADQSAKFCDYNPANNWVCEEDPNNTVAEKVVARTDGGLTLDNGSEPVPMYAYRAPNGSLTIFATTNPTGATGADVEQTSIVATKLQPLALPAVGTVTKYWDLNLSRLNGVNSTNPIWTDSNTVTAVITAEASFTRVRQSDSRPDTWRNNHPLDGSRFRAPFTWNAQSHVGVNQILISGLGMAASINAAPSSSTLHFYGISVVRP
jgi:hypothetical protein